MLDARANKRLGLAVGALAVAVIAAAVLAGTVLVSSASTSTPKLIVSLTFDDGYANQYTNAAPILAAHGMQGTFFVPSGLVGSSGYLTWSQVSALAAAGNEIGGHTVDHVDMSAVTASRARTEACADRNALLQHGLTVTDFAYPYGTFSAGAESVVQECGYNSARSTSWYGSSCGKPCTELTPPRDPYATTIVAFGGAQTLAAVESNIATAETYGGWAQIVIHGVCAACGTNEMSPADLSALLDWLQPRAAQGTIVKTVAQVIGGPNRPPVDPNAAVPTSPTAASATGADGSVALQWSAPYSDGGSAVTGYAIYRGTASGSETLLAKVGTATSYKDTAVTNGTPYYYNVSAVNAVGESPPSNETRATPGVSTTMVSDQFTRTVANGFGTPNTGPAWNVSSATQTSVANGEGIISGWTTGNRDVAASVPATASNMDIVARIRLSNQNPAGANYQARITARAQTDARNGYTAVLTHTTAGAVKWSLNRVVAAGGTGTLTLGSGTLLTTGAAGTQWWVRLDVQGTQIKARFWQNGTTEPTTWRVSTTDSQWTTGRPALGVYVGTNLTSPYPDTGFNSYTATSLP